MTNLTDIFRGLGIPFETITEGAINVKCPWCGDKKYHCGIFLSSLRYHCFRCKRTGGLFDILQAKVNLGWSQYQTLVETKALPQDESATSVIRRNLEGNRPMEKKSTIPDLPPSRLIDPEVVADYPDLKRFLDNRCIDVQTCQEYSARYCSIGDLGQRIILPIWDRRGAYATFQARDITGRAQTKYVSGHGADIYRHLYWSDGFQTMNSPNRVYLVEGCFDVWRMRVNAAASFGKQLSRDQRAILAGDATIDELVIAWDFDALKQARGIAENLACLLPRVGVVRMPQGEDPDSLGAEATKALKVEWI